MADVRTRTTLLVGALSVLLPLLPMPTSGCAPYDPFPEACHEDAIIGGTTTTDWPAVGLYYSWNYGVMCTATLVNESVVLTAAHCIDYSGYGDVFFVGYNFDHMNNGNSYTLTDCIAAQNGTDIAVCLLAQPLTTVDIIPVNTTPMDNSWVGDWLHYVGFGSNTYYGGPGSGVKRETSIQVNEISSYEYIHYTPGTNICSGDSGGPSLVDIDGHWHVAGVNSAVSSNSGDACSGWGYEVRVDRALDFLGDFFDPYQHPIGDDDDDSHPGDDDTEWSDDDTSDVWGDDDTSDPGGGHHDDDPPVDELPAPRVKGDYGEPRACAVGVDARACARPLLLLFLLSVIAVAWWRARRSP